MQLEIKFIAFECNMVGCRCCVVMRCDKQYDQHLLAAANAAASAAQCSKQDTPGASTASVSVNGTGIGCPPITTTLPLGRTGAIAKARAYFIGATLFVVAVVPVSVMTHAVARAGSAWYAGPPPTVRILPLTASYMTAFPFIESTPGRVPAALTEPLPVVSNQCMLTLGPA